MKSEDVGYKADLFIVVICVGIIVAVQGLVAYIGIQIEKLESLQSEQKNSFHILSQTQPTKALTKWGLPQTPSVAYSDLYIEFDGRFGVPRFVLECLTENNLKSNVERTSTSFHTNLNMGQEFQISPKFYEASDFDKGHMAPVVNHQNSQSSLLSVFSMANVAPQLPHLNRGVWRALENKVRELVQPDTIVWVVSGPLWLADSEGHTEFQWLGSKKEARVAVPTHFFKTYLKQTQGNLLSCGAWVVSNTQEVKEEVVSVDALEILTGLDLWSGIPKEQQEFLESGKEVSIVVGE